MSLMEESIVIFSNSLSSSLVAVLSGVKECLAGVPEVELPPGFGVDLNLSFGSATILVRALMRDCLGSSSTLLY